MKKGFLAVIMFVGITTFAQEKDGKRGEKEKMTSEQKVNFMVKKMTTDLTLNEKQVEQVRVLVANQVKKRETKRIETLDTKDKSKAEIKKEIEANQTNMSLEMKKILTPDQFSKWESIRKERKEKLKEKIAERRTNKESEAIPKSK
ncbi:hypothetical protein [Flavobacterium sp.]|uniref:hypothetical protein n=1 Tax=Flavobacterium sp. TaxID=239 RepID=UPI0025CFFE73|nr:hypothetical protein [Flavobacterium sp.]